MIGRKLNRKHQRTTERSQQREIASVQLHPQARIDVARRRSNVESIITYVQKRWQAMPLQLIVSFTRICCEDFWRTFFVLRSATWIYVTSRMSSCRYLKDGSRSAKCRNVAVGTLRKYFAKERTEWMKAMETARKYLHSNRICVTN